jgi:hypothetical protein
LMGSSSFTAGAAASGRPPSAHACITAAAASQFRTDYSRTCTTAAKE